MSPDCLIIRSLVYLMEFHSANVALFLGMMFRLEIWLNMARLEILFIGIGNDFYCGG